MQILTPLFMYRKKVATGRYLRYTFSITAKNERIKQ